MDHERSLTNQMIEGLSSIKGVTVYGPPPGKNRIGVVSFTVENLHPHDVAHILDEASGIMVRSGEHCCIPLMRHIGTPDGTVRASLHLYNNADDVERLIDDGGRDLTDGINVQGRSLHQGKGGHIHRI